VNDKNATLLEIGDEEAETLFLPPPLSILTMVVWVLSVCFGQFGLKRERQFRRSLCPITFPFQRLEQP
jgi:hypothetical protein